MASAQTTPGTCEPVTGAGSPAQLEIAAALAGDERAARREFRAQIARLEARLGEIEGQAGPLVSRPAHLAATPRVLGLAELERVRDSLAARVADAGAELARRADVHERNRGLLERMVADPGSHRWLRIAAADVGEPQCRHWHSRPRLGIIGALLGWWRVKLSSGCPLAEPAFAGASRQPG